jgi:phage terminase large subunit
MANKKTINIVDIEHGANEAFLPLIKRDEATEKPLFVNEGGRASGKSKGTSQALILEAMREKMRIGVVRKVFDTIRDSTWREIKDTVEEWNVESRFEFLSNPLSIRVKNGTEFVCKGLDKAFKIKSLANIDLLYIEEATELSKEDWDIIRFTIRGKRKNGKPKRIWLNFNRQLGHWTEGYFNADGTFIENPDTYHLHTTFQDNKFLSAYDIAQFEKLRVEDPELYKKYALGLPVALKGLVYSNWDTKDEFPEGLPIDVYGLDFGTNDPMVLTRVGIREKEMWLDERLYRRGMHTGELIEALPSLMHDRYAEIHADSADANSILQLQNAGYNVVPAEKGKDSVFAGIMLCRGFKTHITARSVNVRKDYENYKWMEDARGNSTEKPQHLSSHSPDSVRYPVFNLFHEPSITVSDARAVEVEPMQSITIGEMF